MYGAETGVTFNSLGSIRKTLVLIIILFFLGCSTKTQFIESDGSIFTIKSGSDALVTMKNEKREVTVDNRGKPNIFQSLLEFIFFISSEITQINK